MITDTAFSRGRIKLFSIDENGEKTLLHQGANLIVNGGRAAVANALAGQPNQFPISLGFGESGTPTDPSDAALTNPIVKSFISVAPSGNSVEFQAELLQSEGNGQTFREVGLFTQAGPMFARSVIGAFDKTNQLRILIVWTIYT